MDQFVSDNGPMETEGESTRPTNRLPADVQPKPAADVIDLDRYKVHHDSTARADAPTRSLQIRCRKPKPGEFFRVRGGEEWRMKVRLIEEKSSREFYLLDGSLMSDEVVAKYSHEVVLLVASNALRQVFIWPLKQAENDWNLSAQRGAEDAVDEWIALDSDMDEGAYRRRDAMGELPDPIWPDEDITTLVDRCFRRRRINDFDHKVIQKLHGVIA